MFVNSFPFLITLTKKSKKFTSKYVPNRTTAHLSSSLNKIVKLYAGNVFVVNVVMMDMEFEKKVGKNIDNIEVNTTADRDHVG